MFREGLLFKVGDKISESIDITDEMVRGFAEVSGDRNPMHLDEEYAKTTRFGRRIAHGMLSAALISRILGNQLGPGGIYLGQTLKFLQPIFIGDRVTIEVEVLNIRESVGIGIARTIIRNQNDEIVVKGEATMMASEFV